MAKLLLPLVFILGGAAIVVLLIVPAWQDFLAIRADTKHLQDINAEVDTLTQKRDSLASQISGISKENLQRLDQVIPSGAQGPEFLVSMQNVAASHGLRVSSLDLSGTLSTKAKMSKSPAFVPSGQQAGQQRGQQSAAPKTYETLSANMGVSGQYDAFKEFLRDVESSIRITDISSLSLSPSDKGFDFKLTLKTYYQ